MNKLLQLEIEFEGWDKKIEEYLNQINICRQNQSRLRGEIARARRLEREELQDGKH